LIAEFAGVGSISGLSSVKAQPITEALHNYDSYRPRPAASDSMDIRARAAVSESSQLVYPGPWSKSRAADQPAAALALAVDRLGLAD